VQFPPPVGRIAVNVSGIDPLPPERCDGPDDTSPSSPLSYSMSFRLNSGPSFRFHRQATALKLSRSPLGAVVVAAALSSVLVAAEDGDLTWVGGTVWQMHRQVLRFHCLLVLWLANPRALPFRAEWVRAKLPHPRNTRIVDAMLRAQCENALLARADEKLAREQGDLSAALESVQGLLARCCAALTRHPAVQRHAGEAAIGCVEEDSSVRAVGREESSAHRLLEELQPGGRRKTPKPAIRGAVARGQPFSSLMLDARSTATPPVEEMSCRTPPCTQGLRGHITSPISILNFGSSQWEMDGTP